MFVVSGFVYGMGVRLSFSTVFGGVLLPVRAALVAGLWFFVVGGPRGFCVKCIFYSKAGAYEAFCRLRS